MCDFCRKFDFGAAKCEVDEYGARIANAGGSYRFPPREQFNYCPHCGAPREAVQIERGPEEGGAQSAKADQAGKRKTRLLDQKAG